MSAVASSPIDVVRQFMKPLDYIGTKSFGGPAKEDTAYEAYAASFIYNVNIPGCANAAKLPSIRWDR